MAKKPLVFALVVRDAPWWNVGEVTKLACAHANIDIELQPNPSEDIQMERVATGDADFGVNVREMVNWAYNGIGHYAGRPKKNLRAIASADCVNWLAFAVTHETRITSIEQIKERKFPLRVYTYRGSEVTGSLAMMIAEVLRGYDITYEDIESWGGIVWTATNGGHDAIKQRNFDAIFTHCYSAYGPVGRVWHDASTRNNLRFLPIREDIRENLEKKYDLRRGTLPRLLLKGVDRDVPSIISEKKVIYVSDKMDENLVFEATKALHDHSNYFLYRYVPFSYNPMRACRDLGAPLHPGAEKFYRSKGYLD